jgi:hypothetical protein
MKQSILGALVAIAAILGATGIYGHGVAPRFEVVADNGNAMTEIALHFDPRVVAEVSDTYQDLLRELPATTRVYVLIEKESDFAVFQKLLASWELQASDRFQSVVVGKRITTWSRDRYTLIERDGKPVLLVPPHPTEGNEARKNDWDAPFALAKAISGLDTKTAELMFEGGDFTATQTHIFATALLRERNQGGELYDKDKLRKWLRKNTGKTPILLGESVADVPEHHIGMFVTPLDDKRILVGDPDLGLELFDAARVDPSQLPYSVDRSEASLQKFRNIARELKEQGFEVLPLPLIPLSDGLTYITYNNVLLETRDDGQHAYLPQFGIPELDQAGAQVYAEAGVAVHKIRVQKVYQYNGTVRCLVNIVKRSANS